MKIVPDESGIVAMTGAEEGWEGEIAHEDGARGYLFFCVCSVILGARRIIFIFPLSRVTRAS